MIRNLPSKAGPYLLYGLMLFLGLSCKVNRPQYPPQWAPLLQNTPAEAYSGIYPISLAHLLLDKKPGFWAQDTFISELTSSAGPDLKLRVMYRPGADTAAHLRPADQQGEEKFRVKNKRKGLLVLYDNAIAGSPLLGPHRRYVQLSKASDGCLVVKKGEWAYGLLLVVPFWYNVYDFYRICLDTVESTE
jgi:hypothetical protein